MIPKKIVTNPHPRRGRYRNFVVRAESKTSSQAFAYSRLTLHAFFILIFVLWLAFVYVGQLREDESAVLRSLRAATQSKNSSTKSHFMNNNRNH